MGPPVEKSFLFRVDLFIMVERKIALKRVFLKRRYKTVGRLRHFSLIKAS